MNTRLKYGGLASLVLLIASDASIRASDSYKLESGRYSPVVKSEESVCPQELRAYFTESELTEIRVTYVGDCYFDGPYSYPCNGNLCGLSGIEFRIRGPRTYTWRNTLHDISADFSKQSR